MTRAILTMLAVTAVGRCLDLPKVLELAAKAAEREVIAMSSVAATETVIETKLNPKQKIEERRRRMFDYLVLFDSDDGDLALTESRVEQNGSKKADAKPLLASTGFAAMTLILHPYYQDSFRFTDRGTAEEGGKTWRTLAFELRPGKRSPSMLRSGPREFPLAWKGELRIDEATGQVASIHAGLGSQLEEIGLESLEATVRYASVTGTGAEEWLPVEATIDLKSRHQHWRNIHTFDHYRHFDVTTTETREGLKQ